MSTYIYSFLYCGFICMMAQIILDNTNYTPGHVTSLFVVIGTFLDTFGIYDRLVSFCGAGAVIPITSFGHLLMHGAMEQGLNNGIIGFTKGVFKFTSSGISVALVCGLLFAFIFKPKD